jgi:hypothetical protein
MRRWQGEMGDPLTRTDEDGRFVESAIQPDIGFPEDGLLDNRNAKELVRDNGGIYETGRVLSS